MFTVSFNLAYSDQFINPELVDALISAFIKSHTSQILRFFSIISFTYHVHPLNYMKIT